MLDPAKIQRSNNNYSNDFMEDLGEKVPLLYTKKTSFRFGRNAHWTWMWILAILTLLFLVTTIVLAVFLGLNLKQSQTTTTSPLPQWPSPSSSPLGKYYRSAVAADNGYCSEIGRDVLLRGGNAVDAAVATALCIGVMDAHSSGIGGGHFMTIYHSPSNARYDLTIERVREWPVVRCHLAIYANGSSLNYVTQFEKCEGWKAIAVPGEIYGLWTGFKTKGSGRVPWYSLFQPTVNLLENGFPVSTALAEAIATNKQHILNESTFLSIFKNDETGQLFKAGEVMKRPILANTLRQLANAPSNGLDPVQLFYNGSIAESLAAEFKENGGIITRKDLENYLAIERPVITSTLPNGLTICGPPPPSLSAVAQAIVGIIAGCGINSQNFSSVDQNVLTYHKIIESMKFAYADRSKMGDMKFVNTSFEVRRKITARSHDSSYYGGGFSRSDHGTAHISVLDQEGNAVSLTATINLHFGSKRRSPSTGIIWNNEMDDFSTPGIPNAFGYAPSPSNFIKPGKRPMSSMSPLVIYDPNSGQVELVVGAAGGSRIISSTAYTTIRTLLFNETIKQAVDAPRLHNQLRPNYTYYENGFPQLYVDGLSSLGQNMKVMPGGSVVTGIQKGEDGYIYANSDYRKGPESYSAGF